MPAGTQRYPRTKMVLPLRVWPDQKSSDFTPAQLAHTLDISPIGGRLGGLHTPVHPGQTILLQRGQKKAPFRVVWSKQLAPCEIQAGIESLEFEKAIWGVELPGESGTSGEADRNTALVAPAALPSQTSAGRLRPVTQPRVGYATLARQHAPRIAVAAAFLIAASFLGGLVYRTFRVGEPVAIVALPASTPEPVKPPKPHPAERLAVASEASAGSDSGLVVAEAPLGHVVYPVSPDTRLTGTVNLKVVIALDGRVKQVQLISGKQLLAVAAAQAIRLWRYSSHQLNGMPVEAETSVTVSFLGQDAVSLHFPSANITAPALN